MQTTMTAKHLRSENAASRKVTAVAMAKGTITSLASGGSIMNHTARSSETVAEEIILIGGVDVDTVVVAEAVEAQFGECFLTVPIRIPTITTNREGTVNRVDRREEFQISTMLR